MICQSNNCKTKLKVLDTRQSSPTTRWRKYGCPKCGERYWSDEKLVVDSVIVDDLNKVKELSKEAIDSWLNKPLKGGFCKSFNN